MGSQIDERDASIEFDSTPDCSFYSAIQSEVAVGFLDLKDDSISALTTHDVSVYSLVESVINVSMSDKDTIDQEDTDLLTAWERSDPSCYTPARNKCIVEVSDSFPIPETVSLESVLSENVSVYEVMPSEIEVEPTIAYQTTFNGVRAIDSLEEVSKRATIKLIPVFPEYTQFDWNDVKTDVSEHSMPPSEIEVEFEPWNEWCRGFVDGGK